jgi:hypothetical protein
MYDEDPLEDSLDVLKVSFSAEF